MSCGNILRLTGSHFLFEEYEHRDDEGGSWKAFSNSYCEHSSTSLWVNVVLTRPLAL